MELSSTPLRALALTNLALLLALPARLSAKSPEYENFDLPKSAGTASSVPDVKGLNYTSTRLKMSGTTRVKTPSVNAQTYVFAKEAFLTEKRDEAIKLLRQELDSGFTRNRDNLLLRLGQLYSEKYMELSYRENELYTRELEAFEKKRVTDKNAKPPKLDNSRSQGYLKQALDLFLAIEKEFPKHPKIDEILFFIGFVEMEYGKTELGLRYLSRVIREFPKSRKFDEAVLYLADHHFEKAQFREALGKYRILAARKDSSLYHYAIYKIAWCELNTFEQKKAVSDMKGLIALLADTKEQAKFNLREQALKDLVVFYGETGEVDEAIAYFSETVGKDKAMSNLKLIADILRSKARDDAAIRAYQRLLEEFPNTVEAPRLYVGLAEAQARTARTKQSVESLVKALEIYGPNSDWAKEWTSKNSAEAKESLDQLASESVKLAYFYTAPRKRARTRTHASTR